jgi:hypothetical protein
MGAVDFLFEGQQPPSTTKTNSQVTSLPKWLDDYSRDLIGGAGAIANEGYQAYEGPRIAGLTPDQLKAFDITRGMTGVASGMIQDASQKPGALTAAQPFINGANKTYTGDTVKNYMDPYVGNVIDYAGTLAKRQLDEKFLPSVAATFGGAGSGPRSTQMRATVDRGVRDLTEGLNQQALAALSQGYQQGATTFGADANRQGTLAGITGQLASNERGQDVNIANAYQNAGLTDAASLETIGGEQQGQTQKSLDLAYQDFANERDYPRNQVDWLRGVLSGTPKSTATTGVSTSPAGPDDMMAPRISQIGGAITGIAGLLKNIQPVAGTTTAVARGGPIRAYARGGMTRYLHA